MQGGGDADLRDVFLFQADFLGQDDRVLRDAAGMAFGVRVLGVHGGSQRFDGIHKELAVLLGGGFQLADVMLNVLRHGVEGRGQLANFRAAPYVGPLREVAVGNGAGGAPELFNGAGDGFGGDEADDQAQNNGQHAPPHRLPDHLVDRKIGIA